MAVSTQLGMGAMPFGGGTGFRVWTPFAMSVAVAGTFNGWSPANGPLTSEGNGYWSTDIPNAKIDAQYKFVLIEPLSCRSFLEERPLCPVNDQLSRQRHYRRSELCLSECRIFHACLERNGHLRASRWQLSFSILIFPASVAILTPSLLSSATLEISVSTRSKG